MSETGGVAAQRYRRVMWGGGVEELDRFSVRDLIRNGEITAETELAPHGSDDWRPASLFPELGRYFEMAAVSARTPTAGTLVSPSKPRVVEPMLSRVVNGLLYPIAGGEVYMLIGIAVLSMIPIISILVPFAMTLIMVEIVRTSADGKLKMPIVDTSQAWQLVRTYLRVMFVTIVSLLPMIVFTVYAFAQVLTRQMSVYTALGGMALCLLIAAVYYPACLATVAVWDNILDSLNPTYVARVISRIGGDYFLVIGMWFAATLAAGFQSSPLISPLANVPLVGRMLSTVLSAWALFYVSHLLGYAVYRHSRELGWE
jgi:hypothetical protein